MRAYVERQLLAALLEQPGRGGELAERLGLGEMRITQIIERINMMSDATLINLIDGQYSLTELGVAEAREGLMR